MKKRNILIVYVNNGSIETISKKEKAFKTIVNQFVDSGLKLVKMTKDSRENHASFDDGSNISMVSFGVMTRGNRFTHLYIDRDAMSVPNGEQYISQILLPQIIVSSDSETYSDYEVAQPHSQRIQFFEFDSAHRLTFSNFAKK